MEVRTAKLGIQIDLLPVQMLDPEAALSSSHGLTRAARLSVP